MRTHLEHAHDAIRNGEENIVGAMEALETLTCILAAALQSLADMIGEEAVKHHLNTNRHDRDASIYVGPGPSMSRNDNAFAVREGTQEVAETN